MADMLSFLNYVASEYTFPSFVLREFSQQSVLLKVELPKLVSSTG